MRVGSRNQWIPEASDIDRKLPPHWFSIRSSKELEISLFSNNFAQVFVTHIFTLANHIQIQVEILLGIVPGVLINISFSLYRAWEIWTNLIHSSGKLSSFSSTIIYKDFQDLQECPSFLKVWFTRICQECFEDFYRVWEFQLRISSVITVVAGITKS